MHFNPDIPIETKHQIVEALPEPWRSTFEEQRTAIEQRLDDFRQIAPDTYFYELAFCILTPQSSARNAEATIAELIRDEFYLRAFDPTDYLRNPAHYIRFHNVKSKRLLRAREHFPELHPLLLKRDSPPKELRDAVLSMVDGLGMKEASHFLRNIGVEGLAILDRHIFKHLSKLNIIPEIPKSAPTRKRYLEIETAWHKFAAKIGIPLDQLDLLFWSMETGEILK